MRTSERDAVCWWTIIALCVSVLEKHSRSRWSLKVNNVYLLVDVDIFYQLIMEDFKARLQKLKEQRKQVSHSNFKEVLEENERAKRPANWDKRLERNQKKIREEELRQKLEESGKSYELVKSLETQADEAEKWDRIKASKKKEDPGFIDFEAATKRQYGRLVKQLRPDHEEYNSIKEKVGEDVFYLKDKEAVPKSALTIDSQQGIERMVEDVNKQIEVRSKRSRRRRFDDDADVDYINERNMRFNKKLERFYGNYTEEIKQNFERGTAL